MYYIFIPIKRARKRKLYNIYRERIREERDREKEDGVKEKNRELDRLRLEIKILRHGNQNTHLFSLNT